MQAQHATRTDVLCEYSTLLFIPLDHGCMCVHALWCHKKVICRKINTLSSTVCVFVLYVARLCSLGVAVQWGVLLKHLLCSFDG